MELITIKQAAEQLRVHPNTIKNYIANGKVEVVKLSTRAWRIRQAEIDDIKEGRK